MAFNFNSFEPCTKTEINEFIGILGNLKNIVTNTDIPISKENIDKYLSDKNKGFTILKLIKNTKKFMKIMKKHEATNSQSSILKDVDDSTRFAIINSQISNLTVGGRVKDINNSKAQPDKEKISYEELEKKYEQLTNTSKEMETNLNAEISSLRSELEKEKSTNEELKKKFDTLTTASTKREDELKAVISIVKTELEKEKRNYAELTNVHEQLICDSNEKLSKLQTEYLELEKENRILTNSSNNSTCTSDEKKPLPKYPDKF